ncbi:MAG TPA: hypothetical protein VF899_16800 [Pyrinomonadaceae bacterium]
MIPHRMQGNEICGNGLKGRVTACRRRLRVKRAAQRTQVNDEAEELFPATTPAVSLIQTYAAGNLPQSAAMPPSSCLDYRASFGGVEPSEDEKILSTGEQEVGIT